MRIVLSCLIALAGCAPADFPTLPGAHQGDAESVDLPRAQTWPPDGAYGVPPAPELLAVRLEDDDVRALSIAADGAEIAFEQREEDCASLGFDGGRCLRLVPSTPLPRAGELRLQADGATLATMSLGEIEAPPALTPLPCAIFERERAGFCLDVDDASGRVRGLLDRSARVLVHLDGERRVILAPGGRIDVLLPLAGPCPAPLSLEIVALDGRRLEAALVLVPEVDLAPVHLVERLADPRGAEPAQEYVELAAFGHERVDLAGFSITDDPSRRGDVFPLGSFVPPGGRLLLVPEAFDLDAEHDPPPPPGALLLRLDASLGSSGLSNAGEALYLLDRAGRRVSAMPPTPTSEGTCLLARSLADRRPSPARFVSGPCSPGR